MTSPLNFKGGFQLTESNPVNLATLKFKNKAPSLIADTNPPVSLFPAKLFLKVESFQTIIDSVFSNHITLQFGSSNLVLTSAGEGPVNPYNPTQMFMMFF